MVTVWREALVEAFLGEDVVVNTEGGRMLPEEMTATVPQWMVREVRDEARGMSLSEAEVVRVCLAIGLATGTITMPGDAIRRIVEETRPRPAEIGA